LGVCQYRPLEDAIAPTRAVIDETLVAVENEFKKL
jgi:hypothetical protein